MIQPGQRRVRVGTAAAGEPGTLGGKEIKGEK